jgi:plastocyanin
MVINNITIGIGLLVILLVMVFGSFSPNQASAITVAAGGGNGTAPLTMFVPQNIDINVGQSITWNNPTTVGEPHTVSFFKDNTMNPPLVAPFSIPNNTELIAAIPSPNVEPTVMPDDSNPNNKLVLTDNMRSSAPVVIDGTKTNVTYLQPNANYTFTGDESYVNSGWIWPEGQVPPGAPPITSFTMTFMTPGTYNYICVVHPWMTGTVTVN